MEVKRQSIKVAKLAKQLTALFISDSPMLAMSTPQEGQHHDLFEIQSLFGEIFTILKQAGISLDGLFLNADPGFDYDSFREACEKENIIPNIKPNSRNSTNQENELASNESLIFDELLYQDRTVIEHSNVGRTASH